MDEKVDVDLGTPRQDSGVTSTPGEAEVNPPPSYEAHEVGGQSHGATPGPSTAPLMAPQPNVMHMEQQQPQPQQYGWTQAPPQQMVTTQQPISAWQAPQVVANTNVVIIKEYGGWSTGLCGCFEDCGSCMAAFCCLGIYRCFLADKLGESFCFPCCVCPPNDFMVLRMKVRTMNRINGDALNDCCVSTFCPMCVAAQLSREWDNGH